MLLPIAGSSRSHRCAKVLHSRVHIYNCLPPSKITPALVFHLVPLSIHPVFTPSTQGLQLLLIPVDILYSIRPNWLPSIFLRNYVQFEKNPLPNSKYRNEDFARNNVPFPSGISPLRAIAPLSQTTLACVMNVPTPPSRRIRMDVDSSRLTYRPIVCPGMVPGKFTR